MKTRLTYRLLASALCALMLCAVFGFTASAVKLENPIVQHADSTISPELGNGGLYLGSETVTVSNENGFRSVYVYFSLQKTKNGNFEQKIYDVYSREEGEELITSLEIEIPYPEGEFYQANYNISVVNVEGQNDTFNLQMTSVSTIMRSYSHLVADDKLILDEGELNEVRGELMNVKGTLSDAVKAERDAAIATLDALEAKSRENIAAKEAAVNEKIDAKEAAVNEKIDALQAELDRQIPTWAVILISCGISVAVSLIVLGGFVFFSKRKKPLA